MTFMINLMERRGRMIGLVVLTLLGFSAYLGLVWSPPDVDQHDAMRIMYIHVPAVISAYLAFFLVLVASAMYLWKRDLKWDRLASACAELGVLFTAVTLTAGSIWAKPIWGVWWTWDPRVTTTAVLFVIYAGYVLFRSLPSDPRARATQSAVIGIVGFVDIPIVHMSVLWWRSLHQGPTLQGLNGPLLDPRMEVALVVNGVAFAALFVYLLLQRLRLANVEAMRDMKLYEALKYE